MVYLCFAVLFYLGFRQRQTADNLEYKVEIHAVMQELEASWDASLPDVSAYQYLREITFLPAEETGDIAVLMAFYQNRNHLNTYVQPLVRDNEVTGLVRFDYSTVRDNKGLLWWTEGVLFVLFGLMAGFLIFTRYRILEPFHVLSEMPYELAKGHLQVDLEENKNHFFGKFIWGIVMLRDTLTDARERELKLLREKKLLLLSVSHDIKIPLSAIGLYAKALQEEVYQTREEMHHAAGQIETHVKEIEDFVKEIISASSEDILSIEVENAEFYLKDYVDKIKEIYVPKCRITLTEFEIGAYENRLLKGDMERAVEVMENLMENAFKYGDGLRISIDFFEEDCCQIIRVFNSGETVPVSEMPHLFDSFFRGSNVGGQPGNGLGLYISRQIMRRMEGDLFGERNRNGMSFCLVFRL